MAAAAHPSDPNAAGPRAICQPVSPASRPLCLPCLPALFWESRTPSPSLSVFVSTAGYTHPCCPPCVCGEKRRPARLLLAATRASLVASLIASRPSESLNAPVPGVFPGSASYCLSHSPERLCAPLRYPLPSLSAPLVLSAAPLCIVASLKSARVSCIRAHSRKVRPFTRGAAPHFPLSIASTLRGCRSISNKQTHSSIHTLHENRGRQAFSSPATRAS